MPSVGPIEVGLTIGWLVVVMLLVYATIVGLARILHRATSTASAAPQDPAMDALRTRLAAGEIDEREYQRLRSVLHGR